jgi:hypothetical protein
MADTDLILLSVAIILTGLLLYLRYRQRARDCPAEQKWTGHGINVTSVSAQVDRVRNDYVAELQLRSRCACRRAGLLTSSRQVVARLPYFRNRAAPKTASTEQETDNPAA